MKYFTKEELIRCYREKREDRCDVCRLSHAVKVLPYGYEDNAIELVDQVLDPARAELGKAITVHSCFRCPVKNSACKGSARNSMHLTASAADVSCGTPDENLELAKIFLKQNKFGQMILYVNHAKSLAPRFIHVSYKKPSRDCNRLLKQIKGTASYEVVKPEELENIK